VRPNEARSRTRDTTGRSMRVTHIAVKHRWPFRPFEAWRWGARAQPMGRNARRRHRRHRGRGSLRARNFSSAPRTIHPRTERDGNQQSADDQRQSLHPPHAIASSERRQEARLCPTPPPTARSWNGPYDAAMRVTPIAAPSREPIACVARTFEPLRRPPRARIHRDAGERANQSA